ncbi:MAG: helix-turn-helix domain-containing protein [Rubrivivax sp.]
MPVPEPRPVAVPDPLRSQGRCSAQYVTDLIGLAEAREVCRTLGLRLPRSQLSRHSYDYVTLWKIWEASAARTGDEGHRLTEVMVPRGNFELLIASMVQGEDLNDGLHRLAAGAALLRPDLRVTVSNNRSRLHFTVTWSGQTSRAREIYVEGFISMVHCVVRWMLARSVVVHEVRASRMLSDEDGSVLFALTRRLRRDGLGVTLVYAPADARAQFQRVDFKNWQKCAFEEWIRMVEPSTADAPDLAESTEPELVQELRRLLLMGVTRQTTAAARLGISVATLKRRLQARGLSFRAMQDAERRNKAAVLLMGERPLEDIAIEVGFSEARAFRRSCIAWFGKPPSQVRQSYGQLRASARSGSHAR